MIITISRKQYDLVQSLQQQGAAIQSQLNTCLSTIAAGSDEPTDGAIFAGLSCENGVYGLTLTLPGPQAVE